FRIKTVLKSDPILAGKTTVEVPRYVPISDPNNPPKYILFCDVYKDKIDVYRGVPVNSEAAAGYVKGLLALEGKPRADLLRYGFDYLEHADKELAADAYLEFAKATDAEIGQVAPKLAPAKLRGWLKDARTPPERLGLYAFLLGGCGGADDAALL